jgi:acyl-CoA thioester hydrolase
MVKDIGKTHEFRVAYRDVDLNGEMFHSAYIGFAEQAVTQFWDRRKPATDDPFFAVSKITCTYHVPLKLGDLVQTHVGVSKIGGKSAGFLVRFTRGSDEVAEAEIVRSACDPETRAPAALPEELRDWLYRFLD